MITEDYVSFETAKLLKEKGFDVLCYGYFRKDNPNDIVEKACGANWNDETLFTSRPTLQMAMKWLREVHKMYMYVAHDSMENTWFARVYNDYKTLSDVDNHSTYEEAAEAAIKYCLENLI